MGTVWRDFSLILVMAFVTMVIWMLPHLNPPAERDDAPPPGAVTVSMVWPHTDGSDVDLWVLAPGDFAVGYSNKGGVSCNLLRDDLGHLGDPAPSNHETTSCRGLLTEGEYVVNVHLYRRGDRLPLPVDIEIRTQSDPSSPSKVVAVTTTQLEFEGQERTALRFKLDSDGEIVPGSMHNVFKPIRAFGADAG